MKTRVYIETTIPSFYFESRPEPEMVARKNSTRQWWDSERSGYDVYTSEAVIQELSTGLYPGQNECLDLISRIPVLGATDQITFAVQAYLDNFIMPKRNVFDAIHLAYAS